MSGAQGAGSIPTLIDLEQDQQGARVVRFVWGTEPGVRYQLQESADLKVWAPLPGDPVRAEELALERLFETSGTVPRFLRVVSVDEQPPVVRGKFPDAGDFGVSRLGTVRVVLDDSSGINPASIRMRIGGRAPLTVADPEVSFDGSEVAFSPGSSLPIGQYGESVVVVLEAADVVGNAGTWTWSFQLEREAKAAEGLFVFGSETAQQNGQRLNPAASGVAQRMGVAPAQLRSNQTDSWVMESVEKDRIRIQYTDQSRPAFSVGQRLANLTPVNVREIFYRRIVSIQDEPVDRRLILFTEEVPLADVLVESAFQVGTEGVILEVDAEGNLEVMAEKPSPGSDPRQKLMIPLDLRLPGINQDLSGTSWSLGTGASVTLEEARFSLSPRLVSTLETKGARVERFQARVEVDLAASLVSRLSGTGTLQREGTRELLKGTHWIWMKVGIVPVGVEVSKILSGRATLELTASGEVRAGFRQEGRFGIGANYLHGRNPLVIWDRVYTMPPPERVPFTYSVNGSANASVALVPQVVIRVYGIAGIQMNVDPRVEVSGTATLTEGRLVSAEWNVGGHADLNAGLSIVGMEDDELPRLSPLSLYSRTWWSGQMATPEPAPITIRRQPESRDVRAGDGFQLSVEAIGPGALTYQWYRNGVALPGMTGADLAVANAQAVHTGKYFVRLKSGSSSLDSREAQVNVINPADLEPCQYADTYPHADGDPLAADEWQFYFRECTSYVAWKINERAGTTSAPYFFTNWMRDGRFSDARNWAANAKAIGFETNGTPAVGAIAHWGAYEGTGALGHVAWVEAVNGDGSVRVSEYNVRSGMNGHQTHRFNVRCSVRPPRFIHVLPAGQGPIPPPPSGMALIPAGTFEMGDSFNDPSDLWRERPVHSVYVSAFYMDKYEVTKAVWDEVKDWGTGKGYDLGGVGEGKAANHPVQWVSWYEVVKWCNARSQKEGRVPAYYTDEALTQVYKTGQLAPYVKWNAGYRLPTEAEWEKAARGGASGRRFPWSDADTITHSRANYLSSSSYNYDVSPTREFHPTYAVGNFPYTSPVGSFAPNGYGLYDMAGNVSEWCWDRYGGYSGGIQTDPRGPGSGSNRVVRGGSWYSYAISCRSAYRNSLNPEFRNGYYNSLGFRSVLPPGQP